MHSELDGKDALAWINGSKVLPDLILLDCMMPNMTGECAACLHRQSAGYPGCQYGCTCLKLQRLARPEICNCMHL